MREILFRGKRDDGEWVEGYFVHCKSIYDDETGRTAEIIPHNADRIYDGEYSPYDVHKVILETVGQFTGLTDKNGTKIFEGDIVNAVIVRDLGGGTENREETGIIGYDAIGMIGLIERYAGTTPGWSDFFQELTLNGCINEFWFEVIGNIHDNPELLEANQ